MSAKTNRIWEIDFLRGIALLLMITFHVVFDLKDIYNINVSYTEGFYYYVGKASVILFMLVSGISCSLSRNNFKRGIKIFLIAMIITVATIIFDKSLAIYFGVLHFFGISMMIYPLFKNMNKYMLLLIATGVIIIGNIFSKMTVSTGLLFPLGLTSSTFASADYYPLFPWFGIFLYGVALGKMIYKNKSSLFKYEMPNNPFLFLGRNTLVVYILHQPLILIILSLITGINVFF